jgi:hypothetical protein
MENPKEARPEKKENTSQIRTTKIEFAGQNPLRTGTSRPIRKSHTSGTDYARFLDRPDIYLALGQK